MLTNTVEYALACDTCDFVCMVDEQNRAYVLARDHEREHGSHFVLIETVQ